MSSLAIGQSGLNVHQTLLDLTGHNVANATNPAHHRQVATLAAKTYGGLIGSGVEILDVQRVISAALEAALRGSASDRAATTQLLTSLNQVQSTLAPGSGGLSELLSRFYSELAQLGPRPDDVTQRRVVISAAANFAAAINASADAFTQLSANLARQAEVLVGEINTLAAQVAQLNQQIHDATVQDRPVNDLADQRDALVVQIAEKVGVRVLPQDDGQVNLLVQGRPLVFGNQAVPLQLRSGDDGQLILKATGFATNVLPTSGTLAALLELHNETLPSYQDQLAAFAGAVIRNLDQIHAQGLGLAGPLAQVQGTRGVTKVNTPLAAAGLAFAPGAGSLTIGITDLATGVRTVSLVAIDPATQSLQDLATALSAVPGLQAAVDSSNGTLKLTAQAGYGFDFVGTDSAGILSALGLNTLFSGTAPGSYGVNAELLQDPQRLALATSGSAGDGTNLQRLLATQDEPFQGQAGPGAFFNTIVGAIGARVQELTLQQTAQEALGQQLSAQQQGISGVDPNEELVKMLQYQQGFQMSAKFIGVISETLQALMQII